MSEQKKYSVEEIKAAIEIAKAFGYRLDDGIQLKWIESPIPSDDHLLPFKIGDCIFIRTVTMIQVGRLKTIGRDFFVLEEGGWVADTKRFSETLETGEFNEFEKTPTEWLVVGRGAVVDIFPWKHLLPKATK